MKLENVLRCGVVFGSSCNALLLLLLVCTSEPLPGATFGTEREAKDDAPEVARQDGWMDANCVSFISLFASKFRFQVGFYRLATGYYAQFSELNLQL